MEAIITTSAKQTQKLGRVLAEEILADKRFDLVMPRFSLNGANRISKVKPLKTGVEPRSAFLICLSGGLGSGKTTFTQGFLKGLGVKGPYTSPTFTIVKEYKVSSIKYNAKRNKYMIHDTKYLIHIYHIDAYRVTAKDILNLGWEEIISNPENIIIIEWADRIKKIIPNPPAGGVLWIKFEWIGENQRKIIFRKQKKTAELQTAF